MEETIYWHDYETFGADPKTDRPAQFAGIRTDFELNIIGEPLVVYCKPADDMLPAPEACLVTGITPQEAAEKGVVEAEFIKGILAEFQKPKTCVAGYNSIRFDDEVTRFTLYRNLHDPYAREWRNGNSRWDIIDMVRLCHAVRPEGINWPQHEDGKPSFRLEDLSAANGISHEDAHDALSDVIATIELAKLIKKSQPKLYEFIYNLRKKNEVAKQLNLFEKRTVLHVSSRYSAETGCIAPVIPVAADKTNKNLIYVYDLRRDPQELLDLDAEQIKQRIFTSAADLEAKGLERIPLKGVYLNRCPVVVPKGVMNNEQAAGYAIDFDKCEEYRLKLISVMGLDEKITKIFSGDDFEEPTDPDQMLYSGGFFSSEDRRKMDMIVSLAPAELKELEMTFDDSRLQEMLFRYKARNYPLILSENEKERWNSFRIKRLTQNGFGSSIIYPEFLEKIDAAVASPEISAEKKSVLLSLKEYGQELLQEKNQ
ncbi:MAG: exodeoxyribonuclease I [Gammaproteobacteria bacterium]|nr:MAG: exodeoxyribonuclease I [Gammaproteobacteria bacterium]